MDELVSLYRKPNDPKHIDYLAMLLKHTDMVGSPALHKEAMKHLAAMQSDPRAQALLTKYGSHH